MTSTPRVLHVVGSFPDDDQAWRMAQVMAGFPARHLILAADGNFAGAVHFLPPLSVTTPDPFPSIAATVNPARLAALARATAPYDLLLTYGEGALTVAIAHSLFGRRVGAPPLVHHELGAPPRGTFRRKLGLTGASALIVESRDAASTALGWVGPNTGVLAIPLAGPAPALSRQTRRSALPRVIKQAGEGWIGSFGPVPPAADTTLLRLLEATPDHWNLVLVNSGADGVRLRTLANARDFGHRVLCSDGVERPEDALGLFDLFLAPFSPDIPRRYAASARGAQIVVVDPLESGDLVDRTARLARDPAARAAAGDAGKFGANTVAEMVAGQIAVYRQALQPAPTA